MIRERGFTLIELMISVCVLAIFSSVALSLGVQAEQEHRLVTAYQDDVAECREALRNLERDLREASRVAVIGNEVTVLTDGGQVVYAVADGHLSVLRGAEKRTLARCIAALRVTREGGLVAVRLQLCRRASNVPERTATLCTAVTMRNWEGRR